MEIAQDVGQRTGQRLPRFERVGPDVLPFRIEERDLLGWKWIYDCRFLPTEWLMLLLPGSEQQILRRAQRWFHGGYVDRIRVNLTDWLLAIGNKGADEVCLRYGYERGKIDWTKKNQELKDAYFRAHTVSTAKFRVTLEMGLRQKAIARAAENFADWLPEQQGQVMQEALTAVERQNRHVASSWTPGAFDAKARRVVLEHLVPGMLPQLRLRSMATVPPVMPSVRLKPIGPQVPLVYTSDEGKQRRIIPDWAFTLINERRELDAFLETDRSTMTRGDFFSKLRGYWLFWLEQKQKAAQGLPAMTAFRVLTTCKSRERAEGLRLIAREVDDRKQGSFMFWFAPEEDYDPYRPESMWGAIWWTAREGDTQVHQLLE
jgi:hypothetical protein